MEKINYTVNSENIITGWRRFPFYESEPYILIDNPDEIKIGFDKVINGKFVHDANAYQKELETQKNISLKYNRILELKRKLAASDYKAIKFAEGEISEIDYQPIREERKAWREEINILEAELSI